MAPERRAMIMGRSIMSKRYLLCEPMVESIQEHRNIWACRLERTHFISTFIAQRAPLCKELTHLFIAIAVLAIATVVTANQVLETRDCSSPSEPYI